ncbi:MAG TPA: oligosaccharide flippase family protein, partial [Dissulfurispiraceae bacterium]
MSGTSTKTYLKSIGWLGIGKAITQAGTWCATLLIARILSPADYGLVGMAGLVTGIVMLLGDFGLGSSLIRKETAGKDELSALVYATAAIGFMV